jgi:hypothetical protein
MKLRWLTTLECIFEVFPLVIGAMSDFGLEKYREADATVRFKVRV